MTISFYLSCFLGSGFLVLWMVMDGRVGWMDEWMERWICSSYVDYDLNGWMELGEVEF